MGAFFCLELVLFNEGVVWDFVSRRIAMCSVVELDGLGLLGKRTLCVCANQDDWTEGRSRGPWTEFASKGECKVSSWPFRK